MEAATLRAPDKGLYKVVSCGLLLGLQLMPPMYYYKYRIVEREDDEGIVLLFVETLKWRPWADFLVLCFDL